MIPHIHTLTEPPVGTDAQLPDVAAGRTQRAPAAAFQVGGKGINVAKMLGRLGPPSPRSAFPAALPAPNAKRGCAPKGSLPGLSRCTGHPAGLGCAVAESAETTFLGPDVPIEEAAALACANYLDHCADGDVLAICGSVPGWSSGGCAMLRAPSTAGSSGARS